MYRVVKRTLDILLSLLGLLILSLPLLCLVPWIRRDTRSSAIFRQERIGRYGESFYIFKLRTMRADAPSSVATNDFVDADLYITRLGRFLRKTSLDEVPQLLNVLRGEMSLIGPRPLVPGEGAVHEERMARGAYDVRPGITGWAQVNGRDQLNAGKKAEMDAYYARHASLWLDVRILFQTVACVVTARGLQEGGDEGTSAPAKAQDEAKRSDQSVS